MPKGIYKRTEEHHRISRECHRGQRSPFKGKTYEERYGKERALEIKQKQRDVKVGKSSSRKGKTNAEIYGEERALEIKQNSKLSKEACKAISLRMMGDQNPLKRPEVKAKSSTWMKRNWQDPKFIAKQIKARNIYPNKVEKSIVGLLQELLPNEWKFVGDGELIIGRRNPDFVHISKKLIIEVFGNWWHREEKTGVSNERHEQERAEYFSSHGYQTLVIWEYELKDIDKLILKILKFNIEE